jgi:2'-hydroxyisoflavone reductase
VQAIDARDLAVFLLEGAEAGHAGTVNATGPVDGTLTMADVIDACQAAAGDDAAEAVWVTDEQALLEAGAGPWMELPLWVPEDSEHAGMLQVSVARAAREGLRSRPITEIAADTLAWSRSVDPERAVPPVAGIAADKEADLLNRLA